jgi:predicted nucleotidyltransferase
MPEHFSLLDLADLESDLQRLLGVPVDLIDDRGRGRVLDRARAEAVPLGL